jgi:hypothetical protein
LLQVQPAFLNKSWPVQTEDRRRIGRGFPERPLGDHPALGKTTAERLFPGPHERQKPVELRESEQVLQPSAAVGIVWMLMQLARARRGA